jgi:carbon monoxide dehydrogenase subunit G
VTRLEHRERIERPTDDVFAFVADPRNDERWCPRVHGCEQRAGQGVEVGARFESQHHPSLKRPHTRVIEVLEVDAPARVVTLQRDEVADFTITYELEAAGAGTRLLQRDDIAWKVPRWQVPIARRIVARHMRDQLATLKEVLEARTG